MLDTKPVFSPEEPVQDDENPHGFWAYVRSRFITGIIVLLPIILTLLLLKTLIIWLDGFLLSFVPHRYHPDQLMLDHFAISLPFNIYGVGLVVGFFAILLVGILARNLLGRRLIAWGDSIMHRIPGVRSVYNAIKQVTETVTSSSSKSFREVVLVEYPRKGLWAIAFVTGKTEGEVQDITTTEVVNVFLPTTPNPTSGFLLFVPRKDLRTLHMSVEQGLKMVISGGIVTPSLAEGKKAVQRQKKAPAVKN
jgi:uncharacterized membrane protein